MTLKTLQKRRKQNKTDYGKRLKLLKSGKPRLVIRKTNKYMIAQYVVSDEAQDKIVLGVTSKDLLKVGLDAKANLKNISTSYLTGVLIGKQIKDKKLETPIIDLGMARVLHKTKLFALIKGLQESGLEVPCDKANFPDEARIKGEHLKNKIDVEEIKGKILN